MHCKRGQHQPTQRPSGEIRRPVHQLCLNKSPAAKVKGAEDGWRAGPMDPARYHAKAGKGCQGRQGIVVDVLPCQSSIRQVRKPRSFSVNGSLYV